jgi:hypothetical protein
MYRRLCGARDQSEWVQKIPLCRGSNPRTVQPVMSIRLSRPPLLVKIHVRSYSKRTAINTEPAVTRQSCLWFMLIQFLKNEIRKIPTKLISLGIWPLKSYLCVGIILKFFFHFSENSDIK